MWGLGLFLENESTQAMKEMIWASASCSGATRVKFTLRASVVRIRYVEKTMMTYLTPETMRSQGSRGSPQPRWLLRGSPWQGHIEQSEPRIIQIVYRPEAAFRSTNLRATNSHFIPRHRCMASPPRNISPAIGLEAIIIGARCNIFQCYDITIIYIMMNLADETACVHIGNIRNMATSER